MTQEQADERNKKIEVMKWEPGPQQSNETTEQLEAVNTSVFRRTERARRWAEGAAGPFIDQIMRVKMSMRPTYKMGADGVTLVSDGLSAKSRETIRLCEEAIAEIYREAEKMAGFGKSAKSSD